jgi:hypothetical protein
MDHFCEIITKCDWQFFTKCFFVVVFFCCHGKTWHLLRTFLWSLPVNVHCASGKRPNMPLFISFFFFYFSKAFWFWCSFIISKYLLIGQWPKNFAISTILVDEYTVWKSKYYFVYILLLLWQIISHLLLHFFKYTCNIHFSKTL